VSYPSDATSDRAPAGPPRLAGPSYPRRRNRSAFPITEIELALIAAAAIIGERTIPNFG
jgi:hypothetical protein